MLGWGWRLPGSGTRFPWAGERRDSPADPAEPADFAGWVRRFGLTDAGLRTLHRRHAARCYFLFGGALFAASFGATAARVAADPALAGLALLLALAISPLAVVLTGAVILLALLGMAARQAGLTSLVGWLYALVFAALPMALGVAVGLAGQWPPAPQSGWLLALALGYTLLARALAPDAQPPSGRGLARLLMAAAGLGLVTVALLGSGLLLAGGVVGLLAAAPLLILARADGPPPAAVQPWALAAILVSAAALGFGIG